MVCLKNVLDSKVVLPSDGIKIQLNDTKAFIADQDYGTGTLCVAESNLIWKKDNDEGLCIEYPSMALHAVSRDLVAFPHECIYIMLDKNIAKDEESESNSEDDESDETTVIRFVLNDLSQLNPVFVAMNECQALYPDSEMSDSEHEDDKYDNIGYAYDFIDASADDVNLLDSNYFNADTDPNDIVLSSKGEEVLRRLNIGFQNQGSEVQLGEGTDVCLDTENTEQYEDADAKQ